MDGTPLWKDTIKGLGPRRFVPQCKCGVGPSGLAPWIHTNVGPAPMDFSYCGVGSLVEQCNSGARSRGSLWSYVTLAVVPYGAMQLWSRGGAEFPVAVSHYSNAMPCATYCWRHIIPSSMSYYVILGEGAMPRVE